MVSIKSERELDSMRQAGKLVGQILQQVVEAATEGARLIDLDTMAEKLVRDAGAVPAFKGYMGFRHTLCTSVNEAVVHGIPSERSLKNGDIVGIDFGLVLGGFYGDSAITVPIGEISSEAKRLMAATCKSLYSAIEAARPGNTLKDIAKAVEASVHPEGFSIVREFVGHGIGRKLHEDPQIPNYSLGASNMALKAGMTICIEPMINAGEAEVKVLGDKWTAVTQDGSLSAHYEHSLAVLEDRTEVLTEWSGAVYGGKLEEWGILSKGEISNG